MRYGKSSNSLTPRFLEAMQLRRLAPLLILFCAAAVTGQDRQCSLKLSQLPDAPELFGFRMGMTRDQVKVRFPQVVFGRHQTFGVAKTSINPNFDPRIDKSTFAGVRTISLELLDDKISSLWFGYESSFKWRTVEEFVEGISGSLHLPDAWTSWKSRGQQLRCADFQMTVSTVAEGPSFRILDESAEDIVNLRRQADVEETSPENVNDDSVVADKGSQLYYSIGCRPAYEIKTADLVVFKDSAAAETAGYKQAKKCQ